MLRETVRFPLRSAGFVALTGAFLVGFESERALARDQRERDDVMYKWMARYGLGLLKLYGVEVAARGPHVEVPGGRYPARDAKGKGRLFVMNHRSMLDIFVNLAFLEANIVSRADLSGWPVIGLAARRVGTLFVDRKSKQSGAAVINTMCDAVDHGRAVMVYPEGTTYKGDEVRAFRPGAFLAAQRTGAEIVPVGIAYADDDIVFFGDEPFPDHLKRVSSAPRLPVALEIGEPIFPGDHADVDALKQLAHAKVQALVHTARARLGHVRDAEPVSA
jgi:1-acyl-sn-glycerol-3-phosphate acyltransferase